MALSKARPLLKTMKKKTLNSMLLKCYHHLHPLSENVIIDQGFDENCSLGIFEIQASSNELVKELVNKEFLTFMRFQVDVKDIKCLFQ